MRQTLRGPPVARKAVSGFRRYTRSYVAVTSSR